MTQATEAPKVSICSQILNQIEWAKEMIQSVVDQTYKNWELLVVDDGSTEDLKGVVESFKDDRIQYFRFDENMGVPKGTNFALKKAVGKYVCLMAADEVIIKSKLADQVEYLEANPVVDAVWGLPNPLGDPRLPRGEVPLGPRPEWEQYALLAHNRSREAWLRTMVNLENVPVGGLSLMMKRSVVEELGYMDESLSVFSDHEFYCRFFKKYTGVILPTRWGTDKPMAMNSVRWKNQDKIQRELEYVRAKHPLILPPADGPVTVGIPCYNQARFLKDAVDSVLAQTRQVEEIMILNDGSTDDFNEVVKQFTDPRIRVMAFPENMGIQEALNQMAFRAKGEFFVVLAADDTMEPTLIEKCMAEFKANPWLEFVATHTGFINVDGTRATDASKDNLMQIIPPTNKATRQEWLAELHGGNQYFGVGMYRTKAISEVGGWEKQYKVISDYQMYLKLLQRENIKIVEEKLTNTRLHEHQFSRLTDPKRVQELPWLYSAARKRFYRKHMKVVIATPFYEVKAFSPYVRSLTDTMRFMAAMGIDCRYMDLAGDSYVHRARNTMADMFLRDPDATDLFFIDSDMSWNPEAVVKMCLLPDDVVGGTYPVKNAWDRWTSVPQVFPDSAGQAHFHGRDLGDGTALIEALVLAGGFLRIKRHVLEKFREHYPDLCYTEPSTDPNDPQHKYTEFFFAGKIDGQFFGEDHAFAKRMREMGTKMFIYPNVDIVHWGYKDFSGNYDQYLKKQKFINEEALQAKALPQKAAA